MRTLAFIIATVLVISTSPAFAKPGGHGGPAPGHGSAPSSGPGHAPGSHGGDGPGHGHCHGSHGGHPNCCAG